LRKMLDDRKLKQLAEKERLCLKKRISLGTS